MASKRKFKVTVQHGGGVSPEKRQATMETVEQAVRDIAPRIMSARMLNTMHLVVKIRATHHSKDTRGSARWSKVHNPAKKTYTIFLNRDIFTIETIAHELTHIAQFAQGRLRHAVVKGEAGHYWRNGPGRASFYPYATTDYWTSPWEVEARETASRCIAERVAAQKAHYQRTDKIIASVLKNTVIVALRPKNR